MTIEFQGWPKTPRLNRDMTVTEKIDGTNAAIIFAPVTNDVGMPGPLLVHGEPRDHTIWHMQNNPNLISAIEVDGDWVLVAAQSRKRLITPGGSTDNGGFAGWVEKHSHDLFAALGPGRHFGEWWGLGIQRGYGQLAKRFSLFNVHRYSGLERYFDDDDTLLNTVPVLYQGPFSTPRIDFEIERLRAGGSLAAGGFPRPEGVIVYHHAGGHTYKALIEGDDTHKEAHRG